MSRQRKIVLIDDHPIILEGTKAILNDSGDYVVVGVANDAKTGISLVKKHRPDFILLDIQLPDRSGLSVIKEMKAIAPESHVLILSMFTSLDFVVDAVKAGAEGYITKDLASTKLLEALKTVQQGGKYLQGVADDDVIADMENASSEENSGGYASLTKREQQVLRLIAEGLSTKEIGGRLFISHKTVETHRLNMMRKLGLRNTADIVRYATKMKLVDVEGW